MTNRLSGALEPDARAVVERYLQEVLCGAGPATSEQLVSNEALRQKVTAFRAAFPDLSVNQHLLVADGEHVAVHLSGRATHSGFFQGVPPTGRSWTASCSALFRVEHGRIADFWINWDLLGILEQLGALTRPSEASA
jgi:predicted ester cyclase